MITLNNNSTEYINTVDYKKLENKLKELKDTLRELSLKAMACRRLRYAEVDVELEREANRIQPDELYVPQHIIDTNVRREQSSYVQFITQSPRAVILTDREDPAFNLALVERDLTEKLRFDGWQLGSYANIDSFQTFGYSVMESYLDFNNPGHIGRRMIQFGDLAFVADTRDLQSVEMIAHNHYFTKTQLLDMCGDGTKDDDFSKVQVEKIVGKDTDVGAGDPAESVDTRDKSLYRIQKVMFRVKGIVQVAWAAQGVADDWVRIPRPLFIGRRKPTAPTASPNGMIGLTPPSAQPTQPGAVPPTEEEYETNYPYFLYPYLISENDTISQLKGRVFLDQDTQEAVSSLLSSTVTQARRAAGLYFSKDSNDPNDDILMDKNVFFKSGALINANVKSFTLDAPDPSMFSAIQMLVTSNQSETSQVNFAATNRKDSRKTAKELTLAERQNQSLSTVQVVLYSIALKNQFTLESEIIKSRVLAGLIKVSPALMELYKRDWTVKPSGDVDVIEKQQLVKSMMEAWPVMANTPAAQPFLMDMLEKMFPDNAPKYMSAFQQAEQQKQSQQAQQMNAMLQKAMQISEGIITLSKHKEFFSDVGVIHAYPIVQQTAKELETIAKQVGVKQ